VDAVLYLGAFALGSLVGFAELISRYRDEPFRAVTSPASAAYLLTNGGASCVALYIIKAAGWKFGAATLPDASPALVPLWQVLVAGFAAAAFFRSSFFVVRLGDKDVQVGPGAVLQIITGAMDRAVDRNRAAKRAEAVAKLMDGIDFELASEALPAHCLALMQNLSAEDVSKIGEAVKRLKEPSAIPHEVKALNLGLLLMNSVGEDVLRSAIESIGDKIKRA
jgi:hypothetical protein